MPGTFDAAALLKSVLSVVEPTLEERLQSLEETLLKKANGEAGAEVQAYGQDLRAVGRQIAEALRSAVIEGMRTRDRHLAQLVVIDRAAAQTDNLIRLQQRIGTEIERVGLRRVVDLTDLSFFNLADSGGVLPGAETDTGAYELVAPAYVDADTGQVVERGWVRRRPSADSSQPQGKRHGRVSRQHKGKKDRSDGGVGATGGTRASEDGDSANAPENGARSTLPLPGAVDPRDDAPTTRPADGPPRKRPGGDGYEGGSKGPDRPCKQATLGDPEQQRRGRDERRQQDGPAFSRPAEAANQESRNGSQPAEERGGSAPSGDAGLSDADGREPTGKHQPKTGRGRTNGPVPRREAAARDASRIATSFFVKRLLGDAAEKKQPPRESS
ncbi:hypothetical protein [Streptomyces europaeiscabiei]|uniref:hypothetical protein n=1 Tax=Streptomyces europaeiscabiei TaxID=146819 RepID=UPI0038F5E47D